MTNPCGDIGRKSCVCMSESMIGENSIDSIELVNRGGDTSPAVAAQSGEENQ